MRTTIDQAGRVVIPASLRARLGLKPGTELEAILDDGAVRLVRAVPGPRLVRAGRRGVARPTAPARSLPRVDLPGPIDEERGRWPR
ncbi:MAG: AbrB/MazE/SpoVT family DNA-binding domain-containing protein [Planctomycetes bacterium]|nr:AbrB/MazE/SpoVT family DNA-binding domain-containing protein [Planctomycetota bacterium]